jgi:hypothetical protein
MTYDQETSAIGARGAIFFSAILIVLWATRSPPAKPIESTRASILTCTVKSNIDGVITLNDDCKITEVK